MIFAPEGRFLGRGKGGWRFMKTRGLEIQNPGFRNLRFLTLFSGSFFASFSTLFDTPGREDRFETFRDFGPREPQGLLCVAVPIAMLTLSLLIREDFWLSLDFPSDSSSLSTFAGGYRDWVTKKQSTQRTSRDCTANG